MVFAVQVGDSDFSAKGGPLMALSTGDVVAADGGGPKVKRGRGRVCSWGMDVWVHTSFDGKVEV